MEKSTTSDIRLIIINSMDAGTVDATGFGTFDTDYGAVAGYGTFGRFGLVLLLLLLLLLMGFCTRCRRIRPRFGVRIRPPLLLLRR